MELLGRLIHVLIIVLGVKVGAYVGLFSAIAGGHNSDALAVISGLVGFALTIWGSHLIGKWVSQGTRSRN